MYVWHLRACQKRICMSYMHVHPQTKSVLTMPKNMLLIYVCVCVCVCVHAYIKYCNDDAKKHAPDSKYVCVCVCVCVCVAYIKYCNDGAEKHAPDSGVCVCVKQNKLGVCVFERESVCVYKTN